MSTITATHRQDIDMDFTRDAEWPWTARILLALVYASTGAMRLTLSDAQLASLGDWTHGILSPAPLGIALMLASASLLAPRTRRLSAATLAGGFLLLVFSAVSFLFHTLEPNTPWLTDLGRLALLVYVLRDAWKVRTSRFMDRQPVM